MTCYDRRMKFWETAQEVLSKSDALQRSWFEIWRVVKVLTQNLTRCKRVHSKCDKMKKNWFKIMHFTKTFSFKIMHFRKILTFRIMLSRNFFFFKIVLSKTARDTQSMSILRSKLNENALFCVQHFFSKSAFENTFFLQNRAFQKIFFLQYHAF